jgi:DNA-directed RNA polymerase subunit alpha
MFADYNTALDYKTENELLKQQNKELYRKFLRNQEDQANKDADSNPIVQYFIKNGYDIKDLTKGFLFHENLSVRAVGCLRAAYITNIEELLSYHKSDLLRFRNMGKKTLDEICEWLEEKYNLELNY